MDEPDCVLVGATDVEYVHVVGTVGTPVLEVLVTPAHIVSITVLSAA